MGKSSVLVLLALLCVLSQARQNLRGFSRTTRESKIDDLLHQAALEEDEQPKDEDMLRAYDHYEDLYGSCPLNLAQAIECRDPEHSSQEIFSLAATVEQPVEKIRGIGKRMAVCSILEVDAEKSLGPIRAITTILAKPLTAPLDIVLAGIRLIRNLVKGRFAAAADQIVVFLQLNPLSPLMSVVGDLVYVVGSCFTDVDVKATLCALCATALSHALVTRERPESGSGPFLSPDPDTNPVRELQNALGYPYKYKKRPGHDDNICGLDVQAISDIGAERDDNRNPLARTRAIQSALKHVGENHVRQTRGLLTLRIREFLQRPIESAFNLLTVDEHALIANAAEAILHPSTQIEVPMSEGGFEIEDLTKFYFTGGIEPKLETLSLRQCGRACKLVTDVRTCSAQCRACECTIS